jgi:hypothetical protein
VDHAPETAAPPPRSAQYPPPAAAPPPPNPYGSAQQAYSPQGAFPPQATYPPQGAYPPPPAPYGAPAGYGYYAQAQRTNGMAIASMVLGIIWIYWIGSILALVFGYIAKKQISESRGTQGGGGMATAGIVLGWVGIGILIVVIVIAIIAAATGNHSSCRPTYYRSC